MSVQLEILFGFFSDFDFFENFNGLGMTTTSEDSDVTPLLEKIIGQVVEVGELGKYAIFSKNLKGVELFEGMKRLNSEFQQWVDAGADKSTDSGNAEQVLHEDWNFEKTKK